MRKFIAILVLAGCLIPSVAEARMFRFFFSNRHVSVRVERESCVGPTCGSPRSKFRFQRWFGNRKVQRTIDIRRSCVGDSCLLRR